MRTGAATIAHLAPTGSAAGTEALCGYRLDGIPLAKAHPTCPRCAELAATPSAAPLTRVESHKHVWASAGAIQHPGGWAPAYRCTVCGDVVEDLSRLRTRVPRTET